jgi:hypothetical protein
MDLINLYRRWKLSLLERRYTWLGLKKRALDEEIDHLEQEVMDLEELKGEAEYGSLERVQLDEYWEQTLVEASDQLFDARTDYEAVHTKYNDVFQEILRLSCLLEPKRD